MLTGHDALFRLLPAYIRQRDAQDGGALQQLLAIVDAQANMVERDIQQMYDNWFIETCEPWVVPYIADLLGHDARAAGTADSPGLQQVLSPRRDVAHAIAHGRRKGTLLLLEALARDVAGWPAAAVEFYRRLAAAQHLDHPHPDRPATPDLHAAAAPGAPAPFDTACRTVDVRRIRNGQSRGCYNIPSVGLFVFRMRRYSVTATPARCHRDAGLHCLSFSVLGNDTALYRKPEPATESATHGTGPANVPLPIGRRAMEADAPPDAVAARADPALVGPQRSLSVIVQDWPKKGQSGPLPASAIIPADLSSWSYRVPADCVAVDPQLGRLMFPKSQLPRKTVKVSYGYGFAMDLGGGEYVRPPLPLPAHVSRARVHPAGSGPLPPGEFASVADAIADWQGRRPATQPALVVELAASGIYGGRLDLVLGRDESVWIVAAPLTRPVLSLDDDLGAGTDAMSVRGAAGSRFALDGVLVAGHGINIGARQPDNAESAAAPRPDDLCEVLVRHSTFVPGWGLDCGCTPEQPAEASIVIDGSSACLRIDHSIVGGIEVLSSGDSGTLARIVVSDSIVDATADGQQAIGGAAGAFGAARLCAARSTIVGEVAVNAIEQAEDCIFTGRVEVVRRQIGCVRYCYVRTDARTPRRYRCQPETAVADAAAQVDADPAIEPAQRAARRAEAQRAAALRVVPDFESARYGTGNYLRLSLTGAPEIARGAHDESEMGVYHDLFEPQRAELLDARLADAVPAGFDAAVLFAS